MKYNKFIAIGIGVSIFSTSMYTSYAWFTSQSQVQKNSITFSNNVYDDGREVDIGNCKGNHNHNYVRLRVDNSMWGGKLLRDIISYEGFGQFSSMSEPTFGILDYGWIRVKLNSNINFENIKTQPTGSYDMRVKMRVSKAGGSKNEYVTFGIEFINKSVGNNHKLEAVWTIIDRVDIKSVNSNDVEDEIAPPTEPEQTPGEGDKPTEPEQTPGEGDKPTEPEQTPGEGDKPTEPEQTPGEEDKPVEPEQTLENQ